MQYLVACGTYRSGTTMLSEILSKHSELVFTSELCTFRGLNYIHDALLRLKFSNGNIGLQTTLKNNIKDNYVTLLNTFTRFQYPQDIIDNLIKLSNKNCNMYGDKFPQYIFDLEYIIPAFKNLKVIMCIRDCREVIESQIKNYYRLSGFNVPFWCKPTVKECIKMQSSWLDYMRVWESIKLLYKDLNFLEINYKDLVLGKQKTIDRLGNFLNIEKNELQAIADKIINDKTIGMWKNKYPDSQEIGVYNVYMLVR